VIKGDYSAAGGVVYDAAGRVLLLDRPSRFEVRLPKGHVDPGEPPLDAARREVAEESGYDDLDLLADLGERVVTFDYRGERITRSERYYVFSLASDRQIARRPKDAAQFQVRWLLPAEALHALTFDSEREWVRRALAR
jgi:8-oxo-dGTP pyrophosphatase MutT (NUDIX family)